jgi:UDP-GlcNAc:undecaprenyl-phosphate GlcNAc-1-phosphate transferase
LTVLALVLGLSAFICSAVLTAIIRRWAVKVDFVARPAHDRYHRSVIPLGGGIAIFWTMAMFILGGVAAVKLFIAPGYMDWLGESVTIHTVGFLSKAKELLITVGAILALHLLGLWDDKKRLGPMFKLAVQFAVAFVLAGLADIRVELFIPNQIITTILSAIWIVLIINAFNFLDNMDGLTAGIAIITSSILLWAAALSGQVFISAVAVTLIGALLGFLLFNFPPASIFMGDAGSLVVGAFVALLTLKTTYYHENQSGGAGAVLMPLVVMAVPLYDFLSVTFLRISQGKSPFVGDTQHFSHRLKRRGLSDTQTALTLYLATLCTGFGATFLNQVNVGGVILVFAQTVMILAIIAIMEMTGANGKKPDNV